MLKRLLTTLCFSISLSTAQAAGLDGYDPVSYYAGAAPAKGSAQITAVHRGATFSHD